MPALRPCLRCGALTRPAEGYCVDCQPPYSRRKQRSGGKQAAFRKRTFRRYGRACVRCGSLADVEAAHTGDFRLSEGSYEEGVGVPLCRKCHRWLDAEARRARGRLEP